MKQKFILIFFIYYSIFAQSEVLVNTFKTSDQREPVFAKLELTNDFAVVWTSTNQIDSNSEGDIYLQFLDKDLRPFRDEILVNDTTIGDQKNPQIASNKNNDFIVVWSSYDKSNSQNFYDIKAKVFPVEQSYVDHEFLVNDTRINSQIKPDVAINSDRNFVIAWESWYQDGDERGIYAKIFKNFVNPIGKEFLVNTTTEYSQARPVVKYLDNDKFIIVWESWDENNLSYDLFGKIYDSNGNVIKDEFQINTYVNNYQWLADIAVSAQRKFDIVWCSWEQDGYDGGIYLKSFDENYNPVADEILVNSSTEFYQWLPKIEFFENGNKAIVWSSWKIDGSREGIYYKILSSHNTSLTLETRLNDYTDNFQWEPDITTVNDNEIVSVWSSWGQFSNSYDVIIKKTSPKFLIGIIDSTKYQHSSGVSTSGIIVHVVDSTKLTGHEYEVFFNKNEFDNFSFSIRDLTIQQIKVENYPMNFGSDVEYISDEFDGIIVEVKPNFDLKLDFVNSKFINNSGTNISFSVENSSINPLTAPIDIALVWGSTDTLENGNYKNPLDSAYSQNNIKEIEVPFNAYNILSRAKVEILVIENTKSENKKWDVGETIIFLTPDEFKQNEYNTHAQLATSSSYDNIILPGIGDTNLIYTKKPLTINDVFNFAVARSSLILSSKNDVISNSIKLFQNFPNPFNPTTTIKYSLPVGSRNLHSIQLKIYDILGREIKTLVDEKQKAGNYSILFDGANYSSGIYFYRLKIDKNQFVKKMLLLK